MNRWGRVVHQQDNFFIYKFNFKIIYYNFKQIFLRLEKKHKLDKGRENLYEVLGKFYFGLDKILNKISEMLGQILDWNFRK